MALPPQTPVDPVYTQAGAVAVILAEPLRAYVNLVDGEPPLPAPWRPRMQLKGAVLYAHPRRERVPVDYLNRLP